VVGRGGMGEKPRRQVRVASAVCGDADLESPPPQADTPVRIRAAVQARSIDLNWYQTVFEQEPTEANSAPFSRCFQAQLLAMFKFAVIAVPCYSVHRNYLDLRDNAFRLGTVMNSDSGLQ